MSEPSIECQYFKHIAEYSVAACRECRYAVWPDQIEGQLQEQHKISRKEAETVGEQIRSWAGLIQYPSELEVPSSICYSASSERKLLLHKLMCIALSAVVIALCRAIRVVCLHDVSMNVLGVEGADQGEKEPSHHHVAPGMPLPHELSQYS
jgi:hypothetical protein